MQDDRSLGDAGFLGDEMNMAVVSGALCARGMPRATAQINYCEGSYSGVVVNMNVLFRNKEGPQAVNRLIRKFKD